MKVLKILFSIIAILAICSLLTLVLIPSQVNVSRSIEVKAPAKVIFSQVNNLKNMDAWSPWEGLDPNIKKSYSGSPSGAGSSYSWSGNKDVGEGTMTIIHSEPYSRIDVSLDFGQMGLGKSFWNFEEHGETTLVKWAFETDMGMNPISRLMGLMMDKWIGADYEKGLLNLKQIAEKLAVENAFHVERVEFPSQWYICTNVKTKQGEIPQAMGPAYEKLKTFLTSKNQKISGYPVSVYHQFNEEGVELDVLLPVLGLMENLPRGIEMKKLQGEAYMVEHYGSYELLESTYQKLENRLAEKGIALTMPVWEVYVTDPGQEPDTSRWLTRIYAPIQEMD